MRRTLFRLSLLLFALLCSGGAAAHAFTITRTSSPVFYMDTTITPQLRGMYVSYQITNNSATSYADVWAGIDNFAGGVITAGPGEDGLLQLGPMSAGQTKAAFFFIQATGPTAVPQTHTVKVFSGRPASAASPAVDSASFSMTAENTIQANANKVTTTVTGPNPPTLGGIVTITVTGDTGTIGSQRVLSFTPASQLSWSAAAFELISSSIALTGGNTGTYNDQLMVPTANITSTSNTNYTVTFIFRSASASPPVTVSPMGYIASGTQMKHTTGDTAVISSAVGAVTLSKSASVSSIYVNSTATYTLRLTNAGSYDVLIQDFVDTLPSSPGTPAYVTGSSAYAGAALGNPTVSGQTLTWSGYFNVPAGQTRDLTYQVTFPSATGTYVNSAVAHIGPTQIDTTVSSSDNSPATASVLVQSPPSISLVKSVTPDGTQLPGTDLTYTIAYSNAGGVPATSLIIVDPVPDNTDFKVGSVGATLGTHTGVTVEYSTDGTTWATALPPADGGEPAGYNRNVRHIRWRFAGSLSAGGSGSVSFTVRIR